MAQQAIVTPRPAPAARPRSATAPVPPAVPPARPRRAPAPKPPSTAAAAKVGKDTAARETRRVKATATTEAKQVKGAAVGQTKVVARTANQDVRELADTVRSSADQVREMLAETQGQLQRQADMQAGRLADVLWQVGIQAVALSEGRPEQAGPLVEYAEQAAEWLDNCASHIEERGLEGLATDVVDFARRRPTVFLAGAAVVGFGIGRLIRSGAVSADDGADGYVELEA